MTVSQKRYDDEFKRNCVEMLLSGGRQLKPLARELGIKDSTLRGWRDGYLCRTDRPGGVAPAGRRRGRWPRKSGTLGRTSTASPGRGKY